MLLGVECIKQVVRVCRNGLYISHRLHVAHSDLYSVCGTLIYPMAHAAPTHGPEGCTANVVSLPRFERTISLKVYFFQELIVMQYIEAFEFTYFNLVTYHIFLKFMPNT